MSGIRRLVGLRGFGEAEGERDNDEADVDPAHVGVLASHAVGEHTDTREGERDLRDRYAIHGERLVEDSVRSRRFTPTATLESAPRHRARRSPYGGARWKTPCPVRRS